ncbi:MAG: hypothetical protein KDG57_21525 [Rhodoferax sp.]|nr:hypothetical protein [Rhodoferax sp.]
MNTPEQSPDDDRWTSSMVLAMLASRGVSTAGARFESRQLRDWLPGMRDARRFGNTMQTLTRNGFVTQRMLVDRKTAESFAEYTVTAAGAAAIVKVAAGLARRSGPKGPHGKDRVVPPGSFAARLWALMRARGMLDAITAAETLVDAGGDVDRARRNAQRYMARWATAGAVTRSQRRVAGGAMRYVLVRDTPEPPAWTPKAQARAHAEGCA